MKNLLLDEAQDSDAASFPLPLLIAAVDSVDGVPVDLTVCADGYLVAHATPDGARPVVTGFIGQGSGRKDGHPAGWAQRYHREFADPDTATRRVQTMIEQHGGRHEGSA